MTMNPSNGEDRLAQGKEQANTPTGDRQNNIGSKSEFTKTDGVNEEGKKQTDVPTFDQRNIIGNKCEDIITDGEVKLVKFQRMVLLCYGMGLVTCVSLILVIAGLSVKGRGNGFSKFQNDFCKRVAVYTESKLLQGTGLNKIPDAVDINDCRQKRYACKFDYLTCVTSCPLGFEMNEKCPISCSCATNGIMQDDIQFDEYSLPAIIKQMNDGDEEDFVMFGDGSLVKLWNEKIVEGRVQIPYEIESTIDPDQKAVIDEVIRIFWHRTCIDFVPREKEYDYVHFQYGSGDCSSTFAKKPGRNNVNVASCISYTHMLHVLMHLLGFHHEHVRNDRDAYVAVLWDNIDPAKMHSFTKLRSSENLGSQTAFDKKGMMMLSGRAFSRSGQSAPTMLDLDTNSSVVGGASVLTETDLERISNVYCDGIPKNRQAETFQDLIREDDRSVAFGLTWTEWSKWSRCHATCGDSMRTRTRSCQIMGFLSNECDGVRKEGKPCNMGECKDKGTWLQWGNWGACEKTCGKSVKIRYRICSVQGKCKRRGSASSVRPCILERCPNELAQLSSWSLWTSCHATCGRASRTRTRECLSTNRTRSFLCKTADSDGFETQSELCDYLFPPCPDQNLADDLPIVPGRLEDLSKLNMFESRVTQFGKDACNSSLNVFWFVGDFNGDGSQDTMCGESSGALKLFVTSVGGNMNLTWSGSLNCAIEYMVVGDFNGDGSDDIFCKEDTLSHNLIYLSRDSGSFHDYLEAGPFCMNLFDHVQAADINGDGKADLICKHPESGDNTDIYLSALSL